VLGSPAWLRGRAWGAAAVGGCSRALSCLVPGSRAAPSPPNLVPCSVLWAPRPPPRQQLEPEGPGGCAGGCRPRPPTPCRGSLPQREGSSAAQTPTPGSGRTPLAPCPRPRLPRQDLASVLFSDAPLPVPAALPAQPPPPTGECRPLRRELGVRGGSAGRGAAGGRGREPGAWLLPWLGLPRASRSSGQSRLRGTGSEGKNVFGGAGRRCPAPQLLSAPHWVCTARGDSSGG